MRSAAFFQAEAEAEAAADAEGDIRFAVERGDQRRRALPVLERLMVLFTRCAVRRLQDHHGQDVALNAAREELFEMEDIYLCRNDHSQAYADMHNDGVVTIPVTMGSSLDGAMDRALGGPDSRRPDAALVECCDRQRRTFRAAAVVGLPMP